MWAYGAHYVCNSESGPSSIAFDCGIASIPPSPTCTKIDVEILWDIVTVTYLGLSCVVMEGSWIKSIDQGRKVVKKDPLGFWMVQYDSRETREQDNPYVYPATVSQVFFVPDTLDPSWRVVLRHDPWSRRIEGDRDMHIFGAFGTLRPTLSSRSGGFSHPTPSDAHHADRMDEILREQFNSMLNEEEHLEDDNHLEDTQFEDEFELQYVE